MVEYNALCARETTSTSNAMLEQSTTYVLPLGGLNEVGMNCMLVAHGTSAVLIDCGVRIGDSRFGVDHYAPNFDIIDALNCDLQAVVLTHGHLDHIGALPYILARNPQLPVFATRYTCAFVRLLSERWELETPIELREIAPRQELQLGALKLEPFHVTHSTHDAVGFVIRTPTVTMVHTGDFRLDESPWQGSVADTEHLASVAREGVDVLLSDSTNIYTRTPSASEQDVAETLLANIERAPARVVVSLFPSNVSRLSMLFSIAERCGRRVVLLGRSLELHTACAKELGYLQWSEGVLAQEADIPRLPPHNTLVLATGTQAEPFSALARLARNDHPTLSLGEGDTVIFSARIVPGNEPAVHALYDRLIARGVQVISPTDEPQVHATGHANLAELTQLYTLVAPRAFVPIHGTRYLREQHRRLALALGAQETRLSENGELIAVHKNQLQRITTFEYWPVAYHYGRAVQSHVLRERRLSAELGALVITLPLSNNALQASPIFATLGLDVADLNSTLTPLVEEALSKQDLPKQDDRSTDEVPFETWACKRAKGVAKRYLERTYNLRPFIVCRVLPVLTRNA